MSNVIPKSNPVSNSTPRIAIIGCGAITQSYYLPALARNPAVLINTTLVDNEETQLQKLAQSYKVKRTCKDYRQILDEVDGVILALPTALHSSIGVECLSRGIHVLCEKPLAENAVKARLMVEAAKKSGALLAANYLGRITPHFLQVRQFLAEQSFGRLLSINYMVGEVFNWPTISGFYFKDDKSSRGILRDRGAHVVDHICWWLGGKPRLISSVNDSFGGSEAVAEVNFEYQGCAGQIRLNWFVDIPSRFIVECEQATIEGEVYDYHRLWIKKSGRTSEIQLKSVTKTQIDIADKIITNFLDGIRYGEQPIIPGEDVLNSIEFVDECYQNATRFNMPWYSFAEVQNV
ncbi:MAG: Gfo/Idh/MocA family oxidoreductase [Chloroflexi bacterium]|nr:Gfo/Idh/MocA family oxidoreductase [Chloroflexota bacterium]